MYQIKVSNLPRWISDLHLKQHFINCGEVIDAKIALDSNVPRALGHGYVTFSEYAAVKSALAKNATRLDGYKISVKAVDSIEAILEVDLPELEREGELV